MIVEMLNKSTINEIITHCSIKWHYWKYCILCSDLRIPFPTRRQAEIAYDVLRIDPEPKRSLVTKQLQLESNEIVAWVSLICTKCVPIQSQIESMFNFIFYCSILYIFQIIFGWTSKTRSCRIECFLWFDYFVHWNNAKIRPASAQFRLRMTQT